MNLYSRLSEERLYINFSDMRMDRNHVGRNKNGASQKGFSCQVYSKPLGWVLSLIGFASFVQVDGQCCYINNRSFTKLVIRFQEETEAKNVQQIFDEYEKNGYNKSVVEKVNDYIKHSLKKDPAVDYTRMSDFDLQINFAHNKS